MLFRLSGCLSASLCSIPILAKQRRYRSRLLLQLPLFRLWVRLDHLPLRNPVEPWDEPSGRAIPSARSRRRLRVSIRRGLGRGLTVASGHVERTRQKRKWLRILQGQAKNKEEC